MALAMIQRQAAATRSSASRPKQPTRAAIQPRAFYVRNCRPSYRPSYYRSNPMVSGFGLLGPMLASEWLQRSVYAPTMKIETTDTEYHVSADLPGITDEDLNIEISPENVLTISGSRKTTSRQAAKASSARPSAAAPTVQPDTDTPTSSSPGEQDPWRAADSASDGESSSASYTFSRSFVLPEDVEVEGIAASLEHGVLSVTLPRKVVPKPQPRRVAVNRKQGQQQQQV